MDLQVTGSPIMRPRRTSLGTSLRTGSRFEIMEPRCLMAGDVIVDSDGFCQLECRSGLSKGH